eukprot:23621_1
MIAQMTKNLRIRVNLTMEALVQSRNIPQDVTAFAWTPVAEIAEKIQHDTGIATDKQRLFYRGSEITNFKKNSPSDPTLSFFGIKNGSSIYLQCSKVEINNPIVVHGMSMDLSEEGKLLLKQCSAGLLNGQQPISVTYGEAGKTGCTNNRQTMINATKMVKNYGINPGECYVREVAAYLIDSVNVPCTLRVEIISDVFQKQFQNHLPHKVGSLQKFMYGDVIENYGTDFLKNFQRREVHKIGILDIRILNCDRNGGNLLVGKNEFYSEGKKYYMYELIPIDHGLAFPEKLNITSDSWVWMQMEQAKEPFDPYTIEYINNINIEEDIVIINKELKLSLLALENIRISHLVLKKSVNHGLTLYQIGSMLIRPNYNTPSMLEKLLFHAENLAKEKHRHSKTRLQKHRRSQP